MVALSPPPGPPPPWVSPAYSSLATPFGFFTLIPNNFSQNKARSITNQISLPMIKLGKFSREFLTQPWHARNNPQHHIPDDSLPRFRKSSHQRHSVSHCDHLFSNPMPSFRPLPQPRYFPRLHSLAQWLRQRDSILNPHVHPLTTRWTMDVGRIPAQ